MPPMGKNLKTIAKILDLAKPLPTLDKRYISEIWREETEGPEVPASDQNDSVPVTR